MSNRKSQSTNISTTIVDLSNDFASTRLKLFLIIVILQFIFSSTVSLNTAPETNIPKLKTTDILRNEYYEKRTYDKARITYGCAPFDSLMESLMAAYDDYSHVGKMLKKYIAKLEDTDILRFIVKISETGINDNILSWRTEILYPLREDELWAKSISLVAFTGKRPKYFVVALLTQFLPTIFMTNGCGDINIQSQLLIDLEYIQNHSNTDSHRAIENPDTHNYSFGERTMEEKCTNCKSLSCKRTYKLNDILFIEPLRYIEMYLNKIPRELNFTDEEGGKTYELKCFLDGSEVGHVVAYCRRENGWILIDDYKSESILLSVNDNTKCLPGYFIYVRRR